MVASVRNAATVRRGRFKRPASPNKNGRHVRTAGLAGRRRPCRLPAQSQGSIINGRAVPKKLDDIRVTYSGLLGLAVAMGGMLAGLAFTIIVTRQLSPEEFGTWAVIGSMTSYSIAAEPVISYWTTRQVARGKPVGKTSMLSTSMFAGGSVPVYLLSVHLFAGIESAFFDSMLLGALLIPVLFVQDTLTAVNMGHRPHGVSVAMAAFQATKIPAGLALVFFLGLGLDGAILAVFAAHLVDIAVQLRYARSRLAAGLDLSYLRGWIRQAWVPLYGRIPGVLSTLDIILYTVITGSVVGAAYYAAALVVAKMVGRTNHVFQALYPKLLAEGSREHISESFTLTMYFAIPMLALSALFSRHGLFLLNPEYVAAWAAGVLLAIALFMQVLTNFSKRVLMGTDDVDLEERPSYSALLKSRLFLVATIENVYYVVYLAVLAASLYVFLGMPEPLLVTVWSSVMVAVSGPFMIYYALLVRKHSPFRPAYGSIMRYAAGGAGVAAVFLATNEAVVTFDVSIYSYLPGLLSELAICCATYLGITYAIDRRTRLLFGRIISSVASRRGG